MTLLREEATTTETTKVAAAVTGADGAAEVGVRGVTIAAEDREEAEGGGRDAAEGATVTGAPPLPTGPPEVDPWPAPAVR